MTDGIAAKDQSHCLQGRAFGLSTPASSGNHHPVVNLEKVVKDYDGPAGPIHVLRGVDLRVLPGEFVGIRGPSGSGKSTLLNMITGIDHPTDGEVTVAGRSLVNLGEDQLARWRGEHVGVIFQFFQLLPTLTTLENVILPMDFARKWKPKERADRAMALLEQVELEDQAHKLPNTLSGGQQQRAAIARALANHPSLVVGDEPTGNLDTKTADRVFSLFEGLVRDGTTFLMVTHDRDLASRIPRVIEVIDGVLHETNGKLT
jgi:putative ABC transport system ATP-binding protein